MGDFRVVVVSQRLQGCELDGLGLGRIEQSDQGRVAVVERGVRKEGERKDTVGIGCVRIG